MGHVAAVRCVQYDGRRVVSGAYDFMVKVWDPETETCLHTLQGHTNRVYSLQVSKTTTVGRCSESMENSSFRELLSVSDLVSMCQSVFNCQLCQQPVVF